MECDCIKFLIKKRTKKTKFYNIFSKVQIDIKQVKT